MEIEKGFERNGGRDCVGIFIFLTGGKLWVSLWKKEVGCDSVLCRVADATGKRGNEGHVR